MFGATLDECEIPPEPVVAGGREALKANASDFCGEVVPQLEGVATNLNVFATDFAVRIALEIVEVAMRNGRKLNEVEAGADP